VGFAKLVQVISSSGLVCKLFLEKEVFGKFDFGVKKV
jgi:hypothetical protein